MARTPAYCCRLLQLLASVTTAGQSAPRKAATCKALAALCQHEQAGMRLATAWLSRMLEYLSMDVKAHHSLKQVSILPGL